MSYEWYHRNIRMHPHDKLFSFTLSPHSVFVTELDLHQSARDLMLCYKDIRILRYVIEVSTRGKPHIHGVMFKKTTAKFAKVRTHAICHFKFDLIFDILGWVRYMYKTKPVNTYKLYRYEDFWTDKLGNIQPMVTRPNWEHHIYQEL